jgi:cytochrome c oxidase assembly protein subunit 15
MAHFMLSLVLLLNAVVLYHRAGFKDAPTGDDGKRARPVGPATPLVPSELLIMGRLLVVAAALVIFLGTVVTSTGPHGGDPTARRLELSLHDVARLHSGAVLVFLGFTVLTLWRMTRAGVPHEVIRRGETLLTILLVQGAVGYLQYFSGVPTWLVAIHVTLAAALWAVAVQFALGLTTRPGDRALAPAATRSASGSTAGATDTSDAMLTPA